MSMRVCIFLMSIWATFASATVLDITDSADKPLLIGIVPFKNPYKNLREMSELLTLNLNVSGRVLPVSSSKLPQVEITELEDIKFEDWEKSAVEYIVFGEIGESEQGGYKLIVHLVDVVSKKIVSSFEEDFTSKSLNNTADLASNFVYENITGQGGVFTKKIAYVEQELIGNGRSIYRVVISNVGGFNKQVLFQSSFPIISLSWFPSGQRLAYVSFERNLSSIYIHDFATNKRRVLNLGHATTSAPFVVDEDNILFVVSRTGGSEIKRFNITTKEIRTLVQNSGLIATEPHYKNSKMLYTREVNGSPHIFEKNNSGADARITYSGAMNSNPKYFNGEDVMFVKQSEDGKYSLNVFERDSQNFQQMTFGDDVENFTISPNEEYVIFTQTTKVPRTSRLKIMALSTNKVFDFYGNNGKILLREVEWSK